MNRILTIAVALALSACAGTPSQESTAPVAAPPATLPGLSTPAPSTADALPPYAPEGALPAPEIVQRTLANGLTVWIVPRESLPRVDAVLALRGGYGADDPKTPGRAALIAKLLTEGTKARNSRQLAEESQAIGGELHAYADMESIDFAGQSLASGAPKLLELLADVARNASFPDKEVALAKANALEELKANESQPGYVAGRTMDHTLFVAHPYGSSYPTAASIQAATPAKLRAEYAKRLHPEHALLVIAGRVGADDALALAQKYFGDWKGKGAAVQELAPPKAVAATRLLVNRPGSVQTSLRVGRLGVSAADADRMPLALTRRIAGGYFGSRLNLKLREEKGYTYGAGTDAELWRAGGSLISQADVRNEVTGAALGDLLGEFDTLGKEPVGDDEMKRVKRYAAGIYLFRTQLQSSLAWTLAGNWSVGLPADDLVTFVPRLRAVNADQVLAMAKKYFARGDQTIVVVGDAAAVAPQLAPFGTFETVAP